MIAKYKIVLIGILETRVKKEHWVGVWPKMKLNQWNMEHNYTMCDQGRIWVLYDDRAVNLQMLEVHTQFIHCQITWGSEKFLWTCVYGSYNPNEKRDMWRSLLRIGHNLNKPWLIQGDFNAVSCNEDRIGGIPVNEEAAIKFQNWIVDLNLIEIQRSGPNFTWTNYQERDRRIYRKFHWCFANQEWYSKMKEAVCNVVSCNISDNCGMLVNVQSSKKIIKTPFRLFNMWCDHPEVFKKVD